MGLFDKISKVLGGGSTAKDTPSETGVQQELASLNKDGRLHARYVLQGEGIAAIEVDGMQGVVKDISYGGMAVRFQSDKGNLPTTLPATVSGRFTLLDQQIAVKLTPVRLVLQNPKVLYAGLMMQHESSDTLVFLRELIEPLRCGKTLAELPAAVRHERYKGSEWTCLRGEGPIDLILKTSANGELEEALLTFRIAQQYCEITYKNGRLSTGRMVDRTGDGGKMQMGSQMAATSEVEKPLLRHAVYILMCVPSTCNRQVQPLLKAAIENLGLSFVEQAA